jgi:hypothetical protein
MQLDWCSRIDGLNCLWVSGNSYVSMRFLRFNMSEYDFTTKAGNFSEKLLKLYSK